MKNICAPVMPVAWPSSTNCVGVRRMPSDVSRIAGGIATIRVASERRRRAEAEQRDRRQQVDVGRQRLDQVEQRLDGVVELRQEAGQHPEREAEEQRQDRSR